MYSKAETNQLRQAFWTAFGQYMAPVPSAEGGPTHWINYKTGLKHVYFRMQADNRQATIAIELTHPDAGIRELFFEQFREVKIVLHEALGEDWTWDPAATDAHGQPLAPAAHPDRFPVHSRRPDSPARRLGQWRPPVCRVASRPSPSPE